ncbi:MAG TPA: hypothetical protein VGP95_00715 [Gemmatimonadaceae bacterium]|nr:hypothetical protein [Gemmatimonadaceae bacterium]
MASGKSSDRRSNSAKRSTRTNSGPSRKTAGSKDPKRTSNPLTHIRFGSAGSGGAEFEPIVSSPRGKRKS